MRVSGHGNRSSRSWLELRALSSQSQFLRMRLAEGRLAARGSMLRSSSGRICGRVRALRIDPPITLQPLAKVFCELLDHPILKLVARRAILQGQHWLCLCLQQGADLAHECQLILCLVHEERAHIKRSHSSERTTA